MAARAFYSSGVADRGARVQEFLDALDRAVRVFAEIGAITDLERTVPAGRPGLLPSASSAEAEPDSAPYRPDGRLLKRNHVPLAAVTTIGCHLIDNWRWLTSRRRGEQCRGEFRS